MFIWHLFHSCWKPELTFPLLKADQPHSIYSLGAGGDLFDRVAPQNSRIMRLVASVHPSVPPLMPEPLIKLSQFNDKPLPTWGGSLATLEYHRKVSYVTNSHEWKLGRYFASPCILHIFQSVSPPHWQWPAPMGSWRVNYTLPIWENFNVVVKDTIHLARA